MRGEQRSNFRVEWNQPATIYDSERLLERPCILSNFSTTGAKICVRASTIPDEFMLRITRSRGRIRKCRVLWRNEHTIGVRFDDGPGHETGETPQHSVPEPV